ncbi:phosphoesterase [Streptococcus mutans]|nr:phosphoesterase [Streptococcus mutans]
MTIAKNFFKAIFTYFCYNEAMTKLAIMSDLHIDLNHFGTLEIETLKQVLHQQRIDHLHLAGDISNHFYDVTLPFIEELEKDVKVTYNLGNHDMLDLDEDAIQASDFQVHQIGSAFLLAFHAWYDYSFSHQEQTKINSLKKTFWFDRRLQRLKDDLTITQESLIKLNQILHSLPSQRLIVAMHFVPHQEFLMTHLRFAPFNAFLGSQKFHQLFVQHQIKNVTFGHAHRSFGDVKLDGVVYHSRPLGYIREWDLTINFVNQHPQYNPSGSWNLSKRYNAVRYLEDYQAYKRKYLAKEFSHSMTIFDC